MKSQISTSASSVTVWGCSKRCAIFGDIPGEICNMHNRDFRMIVSTPRCCVFIDAYTLVHNSTYIQRSDDIVEQVMAIASLVS